MLQAPIDDGLDSGRPDAGLLGASVMSATIVCWHCLLVGLKVFGSTLLLSWKRLASSFRPLSSALWRQAMKKPKPTFRFRRLDTIGAADAEGDEKFLTRCFVDTGDIEILRDCSDTRRIVVGRTGSGKTALLQRLVDHEDRAIVVPPESLALSYVSNSTILQFLSALDVKLDIFFRLLWRHVFTVEILRHHSQIDSEAKKTRLEDGHVADVCLELTTTKTHSVADTLSTTASQVAYGTVSPRLFRQVALHIFYRVGLIGLKPDAHQPVSWSAAGTTSFASDDIQDGWHVAIHPMFWRGLGVKPT